MRRVDKVRRWESMRTRVSENRRRGQDRGRVRRNDEVRRWESMRTRVEMMRRG